MTPDGSDKGAERSSDAVTPPTQVPATRSPATGPPGQSREEGARQRDAGAGNKPSRANDLDRPDKPARQKKRRPRGIDRLVMEFQPDAVEMEHRKVAGGLRWTLYVVILLLIAAVTWATWAEVDLIVEAPGQLTSPATVVIQPLSTSAIRQFNVRFGQTVRTGDVLFTLDPTFSEADVAKLEAQANSLQARIERLTAEQGGREFSVAGHEDDPVWLTEQVVFIDRRNELDLKREQFEAERRKLEATLRKNEADRDELTNRVETWEERVKTTNELFDKGTSTRSQQLDDQNQLGYVRNQLINAENSILETQADIEAQAKRYNAELASLRAKLSSDLAEARSEYATLVEELNKAKRANEFVTLEVPEHPIYDEFVVVEVAQLDVGAVVQPGDLMARLIPKSVEPELECRVDTKDIAWVRETEDGQPREVRIKLSAFPYVKYGTLTGYVDAISEDSFQDSQNPNATPYFKVRVRIPEFRLENDALSDSTRFTPGMAATAEIKVGRRRVIDYFLYPLFRSLDSSIREP